MRRFHLKGLRTGEYAPSKADLENRRGSSIAVQNASAVTGPTPGTVIKRRHTGSRLVSDRTIRCSTSTRRTSSARACKSVSITAAISALSATSSWTRFSNDPGEAFPTFRLNAFNTEVDPENRTRGVVGEGAVPY